MGVEGVESVSSQDVQERQKYGPVMGDINFESQIVRLRNDAIVDISNQQSMSGSEPPSHRVNFNLVKQSARDKEKNMNSGRLGQYNSSDTFRNIIDNLLDLLTIARGN